MQRGNYRILAYLQTLNLTNFAYFNICRSCFRSPTRCFVFKLTRCQTGSKCRRIIMSKDWCNALSTFQSSMSKSFEFPFLISPRQASIHLNIEACISRIASVMVTFNSTTSEFLLSNESVTVTWNLGHNEGVRRCKFRIIVASGESPDVKGSGESEKPLRNPSLLCWRYTRRMNASSDVAITLYSVRMQN